MELRKAPYCTLTLMLGISFKFPFTTHFYLTSYYAALKKNGPYPHLRFDQCPLAATKLIISHYQRYCYNLLYWKFSYKDLFFLHIYNISTAVAFNAPMLRTELLYSHPLLEIFILLIYPATTVFLTHLEFTI